MTIPASRIIKTVQTELQDPDGIRWPAAELVDHLNKVTTKIVELRPDTAAKRSTFIPVAGSSQVLPATAMVFIDIIGNTTGTKRQIKKIDQEQLDAVDMRWQNRRPQKEIIHFCFDRSYPRTFLLYPPASADARIDLMTADYPVQIAVPTGTTYATVAGDLDVQDWCELACVYGVLNRAYSKDVEFGGNAALAEANASHFTAALSSQLQSATAVASTT